MRFLAKTIIWEHNWKPELNESPESNKQWWGWGGSCFRFGFYTLGRLLVYRKLKISFYLALLLGFQGKHYAYLALECMAILEIQADAV